MLPSTIAVGVITRFQRGEIIAKLAAEGWKRRKDDVSNIICNEGSLCALFTSVSTKFSSGHDIRKAVYMCDIVSSVVVPIYRVAKKVNNCQIIKKCVKSY